MAKVLVTGGAGYIGSHTVSKLILAGHDVVIYDNITTGFKEALHPKAAFVQGDVRDRAKISAVMKDHSVQAIIHFAAKLNVKESTLKPLDYYENNTLGVLATLQAADENGVKAMVFSSTAALFGDATKEPLIAEDAPKAPLNPYGFSKLFSEQIIRDYSSVSALKYVFLRYFNVAGAAVDGSNGQRTADAYHLVHIASQTASGLRAQMGMYGEDYPTKDGTCVRDYIHVEDLADIHVLALQYLLKGGESQEFNCGYGEGFSVKEVVQTMKSVTGIDFKVNIEGRRPGDAASLVADSKKIKRVLGWVPKHNDLKIICKTAYEWEKKLNGK